MKKSQLRNIIREIIREQIGPTPPTPGIGYTGGTPCYACINNTPTTMLFPASALGQPYPDCAPTAYGWSGTQYALPGGSTSYGYPSIWSEIQQNIMPCGIPGCMGDPNLPSGTSVATSGPNAGQPFQFGVFNYDPNATVNDGSCIAIVFGCTNPTMQNYFPGADIDDGSCTPQAPNPTKPKGYDFKKR